jgi:hypothetical protein
MPKLNRDAGLEAALDQRRTRLDQSRQLLAEREMAYQQQAEQVAYAESRVRMVLQQMEAAQQPVPGVVLAVALLGDLERLFEWCQAQVLIERERLELVTAAADEARGIVASAHQQVRALELVLEARAAERSEARRRAELRDADETAARVHQQRQAAR